MAISFVRTLVLYVIIISCIRIMGKRQISQLQTSELVVTLLISDIAVIPMQNSEQPLVSGLIPILVLVACEITASVIMMKSSKFRRFLCGKPIVVINDGVIEQKQMRRLRMSIEDLSEQLRQMDVFRFQDVAFAIMETNGRLSVMKKPEKQQPDCSQLYISVPDNGMETVVVNDGEISEFSLSLCGLSKEWLQGVLNGRNLRLKDVFLMTANKNKDFNIIERQEKK